LQVGALQVLLEAGIQPDMVIGTSVGALNAAFFAADPTLAGLENAKEIWLQVTQQAIYPGRNTTALWNLLRGKPSMYPNDGLLGWLMQHLPVERFRELSLPCYSVAVEVDSGEIIVFGDSEDDLLVDGLMSSTALTPAHPPWVVGQQRFLDGGFGAVLPVSQAIERGATQIIALDLTIPFQDSKKPKSAFDTLIRVSDGMSRRLTAIDIAYAQENAQFAKIDLISDANVPISDFSYTAERIEAGRAIAAAALQDGSLFD